jgi:hypothetical protein
MLFSSNFVRHNFAENAVSVSDTLVDAKSRSFIKVVIIHVYKPVSLQLRHISWHKSLKPGRLFLSRDLRQVTQILHKAERVGNPLDKNKIWSIHFIVISIQMPSSIMYRLVLYITC